MKVLKLLEHAAKLALAAVLSVLLSRPKRKPLPGPADVLKVLLVRIDQRVGEVLLTTPLVRALPAGTQVHVLVHPKMVRVIDGLPGVTRIWPFHRSLEALRTLRAENFDAVVNCGNWATPAVTSAIITRLIASTGAAIGPATAPTSWLMDEAVKPLPGEAAETVQRAHLLEPMVPAAATHLRLSFREPRPSAAVSAFLEGFPATRIAVVNPGGRLEERRVPASAFAAGCQVMAEHGLTPVVTWGPGEEALAAEVCAGCPQAVLAPATDLDGLAAALKASAMVLCNNTGPMHLAVAVGAPTLALFSNIDMARWSHAYDPHVSLDVTAWLGDPVALERAVIGAVAAFLKRRL